MRDDHPSAGRPERFRFESNPPYLLTQRDGIDFNLAYIGSDFAANKEEDFDNAYMQKLFNYGYEKGINGYPWKKYPPDFVPLDNP